MASAETLPIPALYLTFIKRLNWPGPDWLTTLETCLLQTSQRSESLFQLPKGSKPLVQTFAHLFCETLLDRLHLDYRSGLPSSRWCHLPGSILRQAGERNLDTVVVQILGCGAGWEKLVLHVLSPHAHHASFSSRSDTGPV